MRETATSLTEVILRDCASFVAQLVEAVAILLIAYGAAEAFANSGRHFFHHTHDAGWRKTLFGRFGIWLLLGLQFALAADIVRT